MADSWMTSIWFGLALGSVLRLGLMFYGLWQDSTMVVKFTDVDYFVFTDAAEFVYKGESPYNRSTYRYTPLLAWMLQPNITWTPVFGKLLFIFCDVAAGYLIYIIVKRTSLSRSTPVLCAEAWLLNPLPMAVSSRGNAESIMALLVLATIYLLTKEGSVKSWYHILLSGVLFGASIHTKVYPVTYALAIYLYMDKDYTSSDHREAGWREKLRSALRLDVLPNWTRILYVVSSASTLLSLSVLCYQWCGMDFIQETYLYHITRRDTRHNFSPYFYMLYLLGNDSPPLLGVAAFAPQLVLLVVISVRFYRDLPFCCFLQTFIFVTFNKVCTSQYFLWYLSLLPLTLSRLKLSGREAVYLLSAWFVGQGVWLAPAYFLEFEGKNTFLWIWIAGLIFFLVNIWIVHRIIQMYSFVPTFSDGHRTKLDNRNMGTVYQIVQTILGLLQQSPKTDTNTKSE